MLSQVMLNADPLIKLRRSEFRRGFHLTPLDRSLAKRCGFQELRDFAASTIDKRLDSPLNDGRQTPKAGHPVFIAQHATATCCRKCLFKWHRIPPYRPLADDDKALILSLVLRWIKKELYTPYEKILAQQETHRPFSHKNRSFYLRRAGSSRYAQAPSGLTASY